MEEFRWKKRSIVEPNVEFRYGAHFLRTDSIRWFVQKSHSYQFFWQLPTAREGNVFRSVCLSTGGGGGRTPSGGRPLQEGTWDQTGSDIINPRKEHVAATAAVGAYPTGMHSCLLLDSRWSWGSAFGLYMNLQTVTMYTIRGRCGHSIDLFIVFLNEA